MFQMKGFLVPNSNISGWLSKAFGSTWRYPDGGSPVSVWPNRKDHLAHHKHKRRATKPFEEGVYKQTKVRVVDNSKLGMEAMAMGKPPKVIHVYSKRHAGRPHGAYGKLGDIVKVAILGEMKKAVVVGVKQKQLPGIPKFDTNNVVLINDDGSPLGTKCSIPVPHLLKEALKNKTHYKGPEYTKTLKIFQEYV